MTPRRRALLLLLLAVVVAVAGCGGSQPAGPAAVPSSTAAPVARMRLPFSSSTLFTGFVHMKTEAAPE